MSKPQLGYEEQQELNFQLMEAVQSEEPQFELCKKLLEAGANPNFSDGKASVLSNAIMCGDQNVEIVDLLLSHGAKPDKIDESSIQHIAAVMGLVKIMEVLHKKGVDVFVLDPEGRTPLDQIKKELGLDSTLTLEDAKQKGASESLIKVIEFLQEVQAQKSGSAAAAASSSALSDQRRMIEDLQRQHVKRTIIPSSDYTDMTPEQIRALERGDSPSKRLSAKELETLKKIEDRMHGKNPR